MITLSPAHAALRAAAALAATLIAINAGTTGATVSLYSTTRPADGADAGGAAQAVFTLPLPAGTIDAGVLTLGVTPDALIMSTGIALWARIEANSVILLDCDVSDTEGTATIRLASTQLYAGGSVRLASGILG
jgi:hypothetical protein